MCRTKEGDKSVTMCVEIRRGGWELFDVCRRDKRGGEKICNMCVELRRGIRFVTCV